MFTKYSTSLNLKQLQDILTPSPVHPPSSLIKRDNDIGFKYFSIIGRGTTFVPFL
jgi:hypothetical protein